jgi:hypothetical protein
MSLELEPPDEPCPDCGSTKHRACAVMQSPIPLELVAKQLHENFRAACKAMGVKGAIAHDHGYCDCGSKKKQYFLKRARILMMRAGTLKPETLGEAEQALQANVFLRRAIVGWNTRA